MPPTQKRNRGPSAGPANRRALLAAAREIFAEHGYLAPLSAVTRRAGVGQGSLYRHFPDRMDLAVAVFDENITELEALAAKPDTTLGDLFDRVTEQAIGATALIDAISAESRDPRVAHLGARVTGVAATILIREQAAGRIGSHVTAADVMLAISMLAAELARTQPDERMAVARRARRIFAAAFGGR